MLRRADVELGKGRKVSEVCRMLEIAQQTYYRWRQKYGDMAPEMARTLKALQKEDTQLKTLVADQDQDHVILKEAAKGDFQARAKSPRSGRGTSQTGAR
jgi:putative transposase